MAVENLLRSVMGKENTKSDANFYKYMIMSNYSNTNGQYVPSSGLEEKRRTTTKKQNPPTPSGRAHA